MSNATQRNFAAAVTERDRRKARVLAGEDGITAAQADYLGPSWDAFYGSLRQNAEDAAANGMDYRVDTGSIGSLARPGFQQTGGVQYPSDAGAVAKNAVLGQMADENGMRTLAKRAAVDTDQQSAIDAMKRAYDEQVAASLTATPPPDLPSSLSAETNAATGVPKLTLREAGLPENATTSQMLARMSPLQRQAAIADMVKAQTAEGARHSPAYVEYRDAVANGYKGDFNKYQTEDANRKNPDLVPVQTVDEKGNPVTKFVPKAAGGEYAKPVNATTANRVASAETVNRLSDDIVSRLANPTLANQLGPAMGRFNSLRDFIGNPPPEYAELAGEIESYALANMGVHGMRSAQGANKIVELLDKKHTPESLAAAINGLSKFSKDFAGNNKPTSAAPATAAPAGAAPVVEEWTRDANGKLVKKGKG